MGYFDHFSVIWCGHIDSDIDYFEHTGVVIAVIVLFQTVVFCSLPIVLHCQGPFTIFFVYLSDSFLKFCHVCHPVGCDVELNGSFQELYAL